MTTVKRFFILLFVLLGYTSGAWAIEQDSEGYYLIGSVQDWEDFAELIKTTPTANARMITDVDLGSSQAMLGDSEHEDRPTYYYQGTFDGQGYTLTVHYTGTSQTAPFAMISKATIKNIHVDGTISNSSGSQPSVVARAVYGKSTLECIWSSLVINDARTGWDETACLVGCVDGYKSGSVDIRDCLFTGTINSSGSYNGCFVGYINSGGSATMTNCLSLGTFNYTGGSYDFRGTHTNCYVKQFPKTIPESMQVTDEQIADGTIATALGDAWVQDAVTGQPMLKIFTTMRQDEEGYYLIGSVTDWKRFAELVNSGTEPAANAKMVRDVEISTTIGIREDKPFSGTFDGNGHVLTANITSTATGINGNDVGVAPFHFIKNATIKNLKVDGIINSSSIHSSGLVGVAYGTNLVVGCVVSAKIKTSAQYVGGIIAHGYDSNTTVKDCLFNGIIEGGTRIGVIWGHNHGGTGNIINCLEIGSYTNSSYVNPIYRSEGGTINCSNNYYITGNDSKNNKATDDDISDGTTATALQVDRDEEIWVLDPELGIPMLKIFANSITYTVPLSGIGTFSAKGQVLLPEGLTAYYCNTYNKENAAISVFGIDGNIVPAATGVLLEGEPGATFTLTGACGEAPTITDNELVAVTESTHINATDGAYTNFMMSGGKFIRIADESEDVKMPAHRAYLPLLTDAVGNAKSVTLLWETTGIESLSTSPKGEGNIYNLNGQKLSSPLKGINIINGRKVIVK